MNLWFADTYFFLALRNPRDQHYSTVRAIVPEIQFHPLVTTAWVLTEVGNALSKPENRAGFISLLTTLERFNALIIEPEPLLFRRGIELYAARSDKSWSLTDCISFVVMQEHGIREALTGDHHFEQAGFVPLLTNS